MNGDANSSEFDDVPRLGCQSFSAEIMAENVQRRQLNSIL